jgi:hypothetical protein
MNKPTTLEECMTAFLEMWDLEKQLEFARIPRDELVTTHHGLGRWIRNNWGLWEGGALADHMKSLGFTHPDDMSASIIREFWNRMNNKPSEIQDDIKKYAEHWKKYDEESQ